MKETVIYMNEYDNLKTTPLKQVMLMDEEKHQETCYMITMKRHKDGDK